MLLHAVCDAMLGALALGDLGAHFPDTDPRWKGVDSRVLLRHVVSFASGDHWQTGNLDATLIAQAPKLAPYVAEMRAHLAADLGCEVDEVSVKATTTERLGFAGRGEGIAALATVLLVRRADRRARPRLRGRRERDTRDRSAAVARKQLEGPAVQARDAVDDRKPEAGAGDVAIVRARGRLRVNGCFSRSTSSGAMPGPRSATSSTIPRSAHASRLRLAARRRRARCRAGWRRAAIKPSTAAARPDGAGREAHVVPLRT